MEQLALILSILACLGLAIATVLWRNFMPAYVTEKAKNLASKEDLAQLTRIVEDIKTSHTAEIERLKASLSTEAQITERRRKVYEEMCGALRVFIEGHNDPAASKDSFHAAYASAWLWASDEALDNLNRFIALQRQRKDDENSVSQTQLKIAYADIVLAMRKNVGFSGTTILATSYQFVQFS